MAAPMLPILGLLHGNSCSSRVVGNATACLKLVRVINSWVSEQRGRGFFIYRSPILDILWRGAPDGG